MLRSLVGSEMCIRDRDTADTYVAKSTPDDVPPEGGGDSPELWQPGTVETLGGNELAYDSQHEEQLAGNIQEIIAEGGINPETGDPNIVAGPNVLCYTGSSKATLR